MKREPTTLCYQVQMQAPDGWVDCIDENEVDEFGHAFPLAIFLTRAEAEMWIEAARAVMHCGGEADDFRIVEVLR